MSVPNLKSYLELPIQVQHVWDAYPVVDQALIDLEQGQFMSAALLCDAVSTDDRVIGVMSTRINAITGLPMEFKWQGQEEAEGQGKDGAWDSAEVLALKQRIAEKAERCWERMLPAAALREVIRWGLLINAGPGQLAWTWDEDDEWLPVLKTWNPQFLYWRWDTRSYWLIHQAGQVELSPGDGKWVLFSPQGHNHGWLYGLIRALGKLWLDRVFTMRDWSRLEEKLGLGILLGEVPAGASKDDRKSFESAVKNPAGESTFILPTTKDGKFDLRMMETGGASNTSGVEAFTQRVKQLDTSIAVCVLGQNLTTEVSGSSGSRAAAQVHENIRADFLKADVETLASMLKAQVLSPWVRNNWAEDAARLGIRWQELVPDVTWKVDPPEDKAKDATALAALATAIPPLVQAGADGRALLEHYDVPTMDAAKLPDRPPPADVNERPREDEETPGDDGADEGEPVFNSRKLPTRAAGARRGQMYVDDVGDASVREAAAAMASRREQLLAICLTSKDYDEMRARIKAAYAGMKPGQLREVMEQALKLAELAGHLSAHEDKGAGR